MRLTQYCKLFRCKKSKHVSFFCSHGLYLETKRCYTCNQWKICSVVHNIHSFVDMMTFRYNLLYSKSLQLAEWFRPSFGNVRITLPREFLLFILNSCPFLTSLTQLCSFKAIFVFFWKNMPVAFLYQWTFELRIFKKTHVTIDVSWVTFKTSLIIADPSCYYLHGGDGHIWNRFVVRVLKLLVNITVTGLIRRTEADLTWRHPLRVRTALTLDVMNGVTAPLIDSHVPFVHSLSEPQMVSLSLSAWQKSN